METEKIQADLNASVSQEADTRLNKVIGTIEQEKLEPKLVIVKKAIIQAKKNKDGKMVGDIVILTVKHPDKEETIDISKVFFLRDKKVNEMGLWYNEDKQGNIQKGSALAYALSFYQVNSISELEGKELKTDTNDAGYLCIKAY